MQVRTIIYTTDRTLWIKRDFEQIYADVRQAPGVEVKEFTVRYIKLPDVVPTYTRGGTYIDWDWMKKNCPADGHNAVCLHISTAERKRLGLKHPNPKSNLGGVYNRDADAIFDFVVVVDKRGMSYGGMTAFERIFIHELSHGFSHFRSVTDYTHTWDYDLKNMRGLYRLHSFVKYNSLVMQVISLAEQLKMLLEARVETLHPPLDPEWFNRVTQPFGVPDAMSYPTTGHHTGTDWGVPVGERAYAIANGKVTAIYENHRTMGNACEFEFTFRGRLFTARYMHLSQPVVQRSYKKGDTIGFTGDTGLSSGPHLHFDICLGKFSLTGIDSTNFRKKFVDPLTMISK